MPNRCKLQSFLAVSVTVPVYINTENLNKWRADLQNKTPKFITTVKKTDGQDMQPLGGDCHNSRQPSAFPPALLPQWRTQHGLFDAQERDILSGIVPSSVEVQS